MSVLVVLLFFLGSAFSAEKPCILEAKGRLSSAIKHNGGYYVSIIANVSVQDLYFSSDFKKWAEPKDIFDQNNNPLWTQAVHDGSLFASKDDDIRFYFHGPKAASYELGAAFAKTPQGPYYALDRPILSGSKVDFRHPFVLEDENAYILYYLNGKNLNLEARLLTEDGLALMDDDVVYTVMTNNATQNNYYPKVFRGDDNYYVYYYVDTCKMGVARAKSPLGPFESSPNPLLATAYPPIIVKSIDDYSFVAIYQICGSHSITVADVGFDAAGWPTFTFIKSI